MAGAAFAPISTAPPWDWNPIGVGIAAFNDVRRTKLMQQEEQRRQEESTIDNAIKREAMPYIAKKAQLEIANLQADIGYRTALAERQRAEATSINEERLGALEAGGSLEGLLGDPALYNRVFRRASSASTSEPKPASIGLDKLPVAEEPQQSFDLDSGAPLRLDSSSSGNPLMNTFGQSRKPNPLDSFDARMADYNGGPPPGEELAPIGSGGSAVESSKTYSPEEKDAVVASAANTLQTRGGKSTNPFTEFNAPEPEPQAATEPTTSPLRGLLDDYRQASTVLKSRQMEASDRRQLGRLKGAESLVAQQFINNAASDLGMGAVEFDALSKMDPTLVTEVEKYHRDSGGRGGWSGAIDYVTLAAQKRAEQQVAVDMGLVKADVVDPSKALELAKNNAEVLRAQAAVLSGRGEETRAQLLMDEADRRLLEASGAPQISDQQVALAAYQKTMSSPDAATQDKARAELRALVPRLTQSGYAISLDGLSDAAAEEEILDAARSYPDVYKQMFVVKGGAAIPLAEVLEKVKAKQIAPAATATAPAAEPANVAKPNPFTAENMDAVDASTREAADRRYKDLSENLSARAGSAKAQQAKSGKRASIEFQIAQLTKDQAAIVPLPGADGRPDYKSAKKQWSRIDSELKQLRAQLGKL